jgi:hypothetical protein
MLNDARIVVARPHMANRKRPDHHQPRCYRDHWLLPKVCFGAQQDNNGGPGSPPTIGDIGKHHYSDYGHPG